MTGPEEADVVVVGGGVAGLTLARDLAGAGRHVTVLEATDRPGGCVASLDLGGLVVDAGAESYATRSPAVTDLLAELGLADHVVLPRPSGAWLQLPDRALPLPRAGMLGIPASPWAADVRAVVGTLGALRASVDRLLPAGAGLRDDGSLGRLVRTRQGRRVLDRLVTPVVSGVHATHPDDADLDAVLPGLRARLAQHGTLGSAVGAIRAAAPAGSAVAGLRGGMHRLVTALGADAATRGVVVRTGLTVTDLRRDGAAWRLAVADHGARAGAAGGAGTGAPSPPVEVTARDVVLAVPGPVALRLLAPHVPGVTRVTEGAGDTGVVLATLLVDAPALDGAPRGTGVLVAPGTGHVVGKALTHATAKWAWLAEAAGPGRHVVRVSYGGPGRGVRVPSPEDLLPTAVADAAALLGVPLAPSAVLAWARTPWPAGLPRVRPGHRQRVAEVRAALDGVPGLTAVGAWLAGTGLVSVVADARTTATTLAER